MLFKCFNQDCMEMFLFAHLRHDTKALEKLTKLPWNAEHKIISRTNGESSIMNVKILLIKRITVVPLTINHLALTPSSQNI